MDLRVQKTKNSIKNAFIQLRAQKPLEKITVKELTELAMINKATFYLHYQDIYELSDILENEAIENMIKSIPNPEYMVTNNVQFVKDFYQMFHSKGQFFNILFSGDRITVFGNKLENEIMNYIFEKYPELKSILELRIMICFLIQGFLHTFIQNTDCDQEILLNISAKISDCIVSNIRQDIIKNEIS